MKFIDVREVSSSPPGCVPPGSIVLGRPEQFSAHGSFDVTYPLLDWDGMRRLYQFDGKCFRDGQTRTFLNGGLMRYMDRRG